MRVGEVQERSTNFRTISASHVDLRSAVEQGHFREDLYFRISKETIVIPPLRDRIGDLDELVLHFLTLQTKKCTVTDDAMNLLRSHRWPGNIRELQSVIDRAVIRAEKGVIRTAQIVQVLPEMAALSSRRLKQTILGSYGTQLIAKERLRFQRAILDANGNRDTAAKLLGLPRSTFFRKAKELGLVRDRRQSALELG